jgi:hypothetical protein
MVRVFSSVNYSRPFDFPNLETLQQRMLDFITHYNLSAKPINWSYTVAQMENKFATNL